MCRNRAHKQGAQTGCTNQGADTSGVGKGQRLLQVLRFVIYPHFSQSKRIGALDCSLDSILVRRHWFATLRKWAVQFRGENMQLLKKVPFLEPILAPERGARS